MKPKIQRKQQGKNKLIIFSLLKNPVEVDLDNVNKQLSD